MRITAFIYTLSNPITGEIRYVGKTHCPKDRLRDHLKERGNTRKTAWIRKCSRTDGKPIMEIIESFPHEAEPDWQNAERFWITYLRFIGCKLTNSESGGIGGKLLCDSTKAKLRSANLGKKLSAETRLKQSLASIGKLKSDQARANMSKAQKGRKVSKETLLRMSAAAKRMSKETRELIASKHRGKKQTPESNKKRSDALRGRKRPTEVVAKVALGNRGQKRTPEQVEKFRLVQLEVWERRRNGLLPPRRKRRWQVKPKDLRPET